MNSTPDSEKMVLLLGHGSRHPEGQREFFRLTRLVQKRLGTLTVRAAFLELCEPLVAEGIRVCAEAGARTILAIPVFLSEARHVKEDLPLELEQARSDHPQISIQYGNPLGMGPPIQEILAERAYEAVRREALVSMDLLLAGRGSPDAAVIQELENLGQALQSRIHCRSISVSFVDRTHPSVDEGLKACLVGGTRGVLVLPCLLFPGIVLDRIHHAMTQFKRSHLEIPVVVARPLGVHARLVDLILTRVHQCEQTLPTPGH